MSALLTYEEKSGIINQHIKNLDYSIFNIEMSLVEEKAIKTSETSDSLESQLEDLNLKRDALLAELEKLSK
jgi:hypothetical protein